MVSIGMMPTLLLVNAVTVVFSSVTSLAAAAGPVAGARYRAGSEGANTEVVLKVSKNGRRLTPMTASTFSSCSNTRGPWLASYYGDLVAKPARLPIASSGTFAETFEQYRPFLDVLTCS